MGEPIINRFKTRIFFLLILSSIALGSLSLISKNFKSKIETVVITTNTSSSLNVTTSNNVIIMKPTKAPRDSSMQVFNKKTILTDVEAKAYLYNLRQRIKESPQERFLVYATHGGLGNQVKMLTNAMCFAKFMNRTLIAPMLSKHDTTGPETYLEYSRLKGEVFPVDYLFDVSAMSDYIPIIPLQIEISIILNHLGKFSCGAFSGLCSADYYIPIRAKNQPGYITTFLDKYKSRSKIFHLVEGHLLHDWFPTHVFLEARRHLRFQVEIRESVMRIIQGEFATSSYNAVHIRAGDFYERDLRKPGKPETKPSEYYIQELQAQNASTQSLLVIITEPVTHPEFFAPILEKFPNYLLTPSLSASIEKEAKLIFPKRVFQSCAPVYDILIGACSNITILTPGSTFSDMIYYTRIFLNETFPECPSF